LQAGTRVEASEVNLARGYEETAMDQVDGPMSQIAREVRAIVSRTIFSQTPRDVDAWEAFVGHLDVRVGLVVAQQDVESGSVLLDQVVLKRERLGFIVDRDPFDVDSLTHQRTGLGILLSCLEKIRSDPRFQALRLAHIDGLALGVLVQINAGEVWQS